jgi:anthranilate synthase component 1
VIEPDFKSFEQRAKEGNLVPVYERIRADLLTPVGAYLRLSARAKYSCMLESVEGGENIARYTFIGANPAEVFRSRGRRCVVERYEDAARGGKRGARREEWEEQPIEALRKLVRRYRPVRIEGGPPLVAGAIGYFAYDMVRLIEKIPSSGRDDLNLDDAVLMFYRGLVIFDHVRHHVWIVRNVFTEGPGSLREKYQRAAREIEETRRKLEAQLPRRSMGVTAVGASGSSGASAARAARVSGKNVDGAAGVKSNFTRAKYMDAVKKAKEYIRAGDIFQVVPSQRFEAKTKAAPFEIYRALRSINPSPYMYFLHVDDVDVVGASPEMLVKVQGRNAQYRPIAGTAARGGSAGVDREREAALMADPKERAEHIMLVDLGRNDLGRVCEYGSVKVDRLMFVERYSHVMHLVSALSGTLREGVDCFEALMACFPAGTLSGAPKVRAMEIIDELEPTRRGIYAGAILYLDFSGNLDSCIALRTLVVKGGRAYIQAGGGVVADSEPEREYQETVNKAGALVAALREASGRGVAAGSSTRRRARRGARR